MLFSNLKFLFVHHIILQILLSVLDMIPPSCSIRLAAIASRQECLDLEKWLSNSLNTYKDVFFEVVFFSWLPDL